jgi:CelD/BcsL family acetyltransferase involved in cellulose biosynthesis
VSAATALPLRIGARTVASIPRRLQRVALSLDEVLAERAPVLPALARDDDGYLLTSLPEAMVPAVTADGLIAAVRQRYGRYRADLSIGHDAWLAGMSGNARQALRRKQRKLGDAAVRLYRTPAELAEFHALVRPLSALTYQEKLLDAGLPDGPAFLREMLALAGEDRARGWCLFRDERPIAYLFCTAEGSALRYDHVGHDPALAALSPGTVLHAAAMADLFADRFRWFDFLEGEGQHKRQFATGSTACLDLLLLRPTVANRATVAALAGWDRLVEAGKRAATHPALSRAARAIRRA